MDHAGPWAIEPSRSLGALRAPLAVDEDDDSGRLLS
jgi:hypothetical protein